MKTKFNDFQAVMLERNKRIGVPNLALEQAERAYQRFMMIHGPTMHDVMDLMEYMGAAKFSTAHEDRRDLFESIEVTIEHLHRNYLGDIPGVVIPKVDNGMENRDA